MRSLLTIFVIFASLMAAVVRAEKPLRPKQTAVIEEFPLPNSYFPFDAEVWQHKEEMLDGIEGNLVFLASSHGLDAYKRFAEVGISQARVEQSLERFRELLMRASSQNDFAEGLKREFVLFRSAGRDGMGTVRFTGYFQPVYEASRERTKSFQYPIFGKHDKFEQWAKPHPTRVQLEGYDGRGSPTSPVKGIEIAWLRTRYEVFMMQLQGSAILHATDGTQMAIGFAAGTDYRFRGISKEFLQRNKVSWSKLQPFFEKHPESLNEVMSQNNRFVFFRENPDPLPLGSLGLPVMPERSIATDKSKLPPGAIGIIRAALPQATPNGKVEMVSRTRLVLDQDTGSGIKGPGRVDIFMGTGVEAQRKANHMLTDGELYYLLIKHWQEPVAALP